MGAPHGRGAGPGTTDGGPAGNEGATPHNAREGNEGTRDMATAAKARKQSTAPKLKLTSVEEATPGAAINDDDARLVVVAALTQASKQLLAGARNKKGRLGEGSYPVSLEVHVKGDVLVGAGSGGSSVDIRTFDDSQLLAALVLGMDESERHAKLHAAIRRIGTAQSDVVRTAPAAAAKLAECMAWVEGKAEELARKRGLTEPKVVGARAGSVTGKPSVTVSARVRGHAVSLTVDAAGDAAGDEG